MAVSVAVADKDIREDLRAFSERANDAPTRYEYCAWAEVRRTPDTEATQLRAWVESILDDLDSPRPTVR